MSRSVQELQTGSGKNCCSFKNCWWRFAKKVNFRKCISHLQQLLVSYA